MRYLLAALLPAAALADPCEKTLSGKPCDAWQENDFGLDPASKRCAVADGLEKPWCYFGTGDGDWEYCDDSCRQPAPPPPAAGQCSVSVTGKKCDAWGENDFGLDPSSNTCEQVDGLDRPWCYTSGEDWDYCDCAKENEGAAPKPSSTAKPRSTAPKVLEPGCDDDRAENKALQDQVAQFKRNKRALEIEMVELRQKLRELGHDQ